jgi:NADH-quinone oxidoreductase subunit L
MEENITWFVLFAPRLAAVVITLFTRRDGAFSAVLSIGAIALSFAVTAGLFVTFGQNEDLGSQPILTHLQIPWLVVGNVKIELAMQVDCLSLVMALVVTGVGGVIHLFSYGYMKADESMGRYFAGLSLFTFSMLGIVFATNLVMLFIFWELVGVSSYLLIGFWHQKGAAGDAAKKAFITNRLGDFGFLLGIFLIWGMLGTLDFDNLRFQLANKPALFGSMAAVAGLLIFCGAMGKSAQFPLHVWLPDAMEGPTPVSALIHAATMVAAGVYMLCRLYFLYTIPVGWPESLAFMRGVTPLDLIAIIGGVTALLAALIAIQQNDIKRILAYSTLSQLGYMVMAVGLAQPGAATHAFFKALLFLGAGSVIYALHHEQDIWKMGGLRKRQPITWLTFLIATLALCGIPPLSGFYSKDAIIAAAEHQTGLFILAVAVAGLTSFYMFRLLFVVFFGAEKHEKAAHARESPLVMTLPLVILAVLSLGGGLIGITGYLNKMPDFSPKAQVVVESKRPKSPYNRAEAIARAEQILKQKRAAEMAAIQTPHQSFSETLVGPFKHAPRAAWLGLVASLMGAGAAFVLYGKAKKDPLPQSLGVLSRLMRDKFCLDEIYEGVIWLTHEALAKTADWIDTWIISGLGVRGAHGTADFAGRAMRLFQTGNLQTYAFLFAAGLVILLWWKLGR